MAYKYELQQKSSQMRLRVLLVVYVLFVVSAILIGVSIRLQQLQSVKPSRPSAAVDELAYAGVTSLGSDPTYDVKPVYAFAYCTATNPEGQTINIPLNVKFQFRAVKRNVQTGYETLCNSATENCDWPQLTEGSYCRDGQTAAECSTPIETCEEGEGDAEKVPGALTVSSTNADTNATKWYAEWPNQEYSTNVMLWDDTDVHVLIYRNGGVFALPTPTVTDAAGNVYNVQKSTPATPDTGALVPMYRWECQNNACAEGSSTCSPNASENYVSSGCTWNGSTFNCPQKRFDWYKVVGENPSFFYTKKTQLPGGASDMSTVWWGTLGRVYESFYPGSDYPTPTNDPAALVAFKGNMLKFRFQCDLQGTITTPPPPPGEVSARKTGPICVERVAPNNVAQFTIYVNNNDDVAVTINKVEDALPQGFTYVANSTIINGQGVPDTYVTAVQSGSSYKLTFKPPGDPGNWVLQANGGVLTITFKSLATNSAITGTNQNSVVVEPEGQDAIDNIVFSFEVEQTCNPEPGLFDEPRNLIIMSAVLLAIGLMFLYIPSSEALLQKALMKVSLKGNGTPTKKTGKSNKKAIRKEFESKVKNSIARKPKK